MVIAHRGFSGRYPENTLKAFEEALKLPIDAVELDVRRTKDGVLVVIHDETVDRTTNGKGKVRDLTWSEIQKLDAGSWKGKEFAGERIPRLEEALQLINARVVVFLEIKEPDTAPQVVEALRQLDALSWVKIGSFHPQAISSGEKVSARSLMFAYRQCKGWRERQDFRRFRERSPSVRCELHHCQLRGSHP
jgi:glycerophosphoryl diester phosphodiesterase